MTDVQYPADQVISDPAGDTSSPSGTMSTTGLPPELPTVRALLDAGEGPHLDFKLECNAFQKNAAANAELVKDICALANGSPAAGCCEGSLVIGVGDDRMTFQSVRNSNLTDAALQDLVRNTLYPPPDVRVHEIPFDDSGELFSFRLITVIARDPRIVRIKRDLADGNQRKGLIHRMNEVWVRRGTTNELASPEDILALHERNLPRDLPRVPRLTLLASTTPGGPPTSNVRVTIPALREFSPEDRRQKVQDLLVIHKRLDMSKPLPKFGGRSYEEVCSRAEIERYKEEVARYPRACEEFFKADEAYERVQANRAFLYMDLTNTGTAPATHAVLTIKLPDGVQAWSAHIGDQVLLNLQRPQFPESPTPPRRDTRAPLNRGTTVQTETIRGAAPRSRPQPEHVTGPFAVPSPTGDGSRVLRYEAVRIPHGDPILLHPIQLLFPEHLADFELTYTIRADELENPIGGRIVVSVERAVVGPTNRRGPVDSERLPG